MKGNCFLMVAYMNNDAYALSKMHTDMKNNVARKNN